MNLRINFILLFNILFLLIFFYFNNNNVNGISVSIDDYKKFIKPNCFNRSHSTGYELLLGQNEPIGLTIENLITMIEKFEKLNPIYRPEEVIKIFLKRFHMDGLKFDGTDNIQSDTLRFQSKLIDAILGVNDEQYAKHQFPEHQFTEDEKCNLFFTLSHSVNSTATANENPLNVEIDDQPPIARLIPNNLNTNPIRDIGTEVPVMSSTESSNQNNSSTKRTKRTPNGAKKLTKRPREYGVVSFLSANTNPISTYRILLGLYVGFSKPKPISVMEVIKNLKGKDPLENDYNNEIIDPLYLTLSDLYGINSDDGLNSNKDLFGGDGTWDSSVCHTNFVLKSNRGLWATMAEFRGGIDGFNLGYVIKERILEKFPTITTSQVLRYYYSKYGLGSDSGICNRHIHIDSIIIKDLNIEAKKILTIWNSYHYDNTYTPERVEGYINDLEQTVISLLKQSSTPNEEEKKLCYETIANDLKDQQCETKSNAFFILDINQKNNCQNQNECKQMQQASFVNELTKYMKMKRNSGSISVFYNAKPIENSKLVNDQMKPINTSLYCVAYNSTSSECASCKAIYGDTVAKTVIDDRVDAYEHVNNVLEQFNMVYANRTGVPSRLIFWFDYNTLKTISDDAIQRRRYEMSYRRLIFNTRNSYFYSFSTNKSSLNDVIKDPKHLIQINENEIANPILLKEINEQLCQSPQIFQYKECNVKPSENVVHRDFISPNHKQYWAMYPEYFIKSYHIEIRFRAEKSLMKVCFDRTAFPEKNEKNCRVNTNITEDIKINIKNPCKGHTTDNCLPFFFTIGLHNPPQTSYYSCIDSDCQNMNQFTWYFTHKGISCNGSYTTKILSSFFIIIITIFTCLMNLLS